MRSTVFILTILLLISCTSRTIYKKPKDLIAKDQMIDLWTDIFIANSAKSIKNRKLENKVNYMPFIYDKYKIDSARFMRSNIYYTSKIETYEEMFQKVEKNLLELRDKYDPDMVGIDPNLPVWKRDSIRRARKLKKDDDPEYILEQKRKFEELKE